MRRLAALALCWLLTSVALSQASMSERQFEISWESTGIPRVSFSARELIDSDAREDINGGVARRIRVTTQAYVEGQSSPIASRSFDCQIRYGPWEERYFVNLAGRDYAYADISDAIGRCLSVRRLRLGSASDFSAVGQRKVYFAVRAEYRPMTRDRCRQMLRSSSGGGAGMGGLVVNIVRRQICRADRALTFRSQQVSRP